jgi:transcriptional regulator with XRE-family HTH domain
VPAYLAGCQQEVDPPKPGHLAHDGTRVPVSGLDELCGGEFTSYAFDPYGVEVDACQTELVARGGDPLEWVDCVRHGHTVAFAGLRSVATRVLHDGVYQSGVGAVPGQNSSKSDAPVAWRYSGNQMKRWRTKAGVSRDDLAAASNYSPDTIAAMEQGVRMPTARVLDVADEMCDAEGMLSAGKEFLNREKFPARAKDFMEREREAISRWSYEVTYIPGLLQTKGYARALIDNHVPPLDEEMVEERIAARMERQAILTRKSPVALCFVIFEAVLRTPQVDADQLRRLLEVSRLRNVVLQVLPFERAIPAALMGPMVLLETRDHERFAFTEGPFASELSADPEVVSRVSERLSMIRTQALSPAESARFIERMVDQP